MGEAMETDETSSEVAPTFHGIPLRDGWQSGEIKPARPFGVFLGLTIIVTAVTQSVVIAGQASRAQRLVEVVGLVVGAFILWAAGAGTSWNDKGVTSWLFGRKIKWRSWEDFSSASLDRMSLASVFKQHDKSPDSPMTRFFVATQVYKQLADPRNKMYEPPPSILRSAGHSLAGVGIAALLTFAVASGVPNPEAGGGEADIWLRAVVLGVFVGSVIAGVALPGREFRKRLEPWRWKPVAEPTFDLRLTKLSTQVARELLPGKFYVHKPPSSLLDGVASGLSVFPFAAIMSVLKMLDDPINAKFLSLASAAITAVCIALSGLSEWLKQLAKRRVGLVDDQFVIECSDSGLRFWKDGKSTGYLRYPHPLTTGNIWNRCVLESWSDGETTYTIDRARLAEVPVYFPAATYALTEGNGWTTPEAKAIAAQMLAERDWSKPLPKKGQ